ncbi:hypothetical protein [Rhodanobacter sp. MP1X3]|uniref:hypothetical protein n=1 Tax=Rhodanobacter sp. MP1X3 TaxID=2723086 RepID=UPI0016096E8B|nr:hypothetical protein [Rhodanobacter sp. MP1X3]MBB6243720.1 hypothetical protein [Rhodanobacter sp. MP1X3]
MDIDDSIEALRQRSLEVDCPTMELKQRKDNGEVCQGSGYIKQGPDGRLTYKLYVGTSLNSGPFRQLEIYSKVRPGKLFEDEDYYDLTATTIEGTIWTASRLFPSFSSDVEANTKISYGQLETIRAELPNHNRNYYQRLHFFEELELPLHLMSETDRNGHKFYTLDRSEFDIGELKFEVRTRKGSGDTVMEVTHDNSLPASFYLRAQEALQFLTGKTVAWRARVEVSPDAFVLELTSPFRKARKTSLKPPISQGAAEFRAHGWRLFGCFLAYVTAQTHGTQWNPIAYHLHNARESTANSIDAGAVGVSVTLEAIVSLAATKHEEDVLERIEAFQKHMHDHLSQQTEFSGLTTRLDVMLAQWSKKRPQDTLHELAERGFIQKDYIKSWTDLRNRHVHPTLADLEPPSPATYQRVLNNAYRVEVLIYQIIFHLLGYKGPFTDYGAESFPIKNYPVAVA